MKTAYREWIAKRLKDLRIKSDLQQSDLAQRLRMNPSAYRAYEDARAEPSIFTLKRLCEIFGITLDAFMNNSPTNEQTQNFC